MQRAVAAWIPVLGLLLVVVVSAPGNSEVRRVGSLEVTPKIFVNGQKMTFSGRMGASGRQQIRLQYNFGRPGDAWTDVDGFRTFTSSSGSFSFTHPAPAAFNIKYRVVSSKAVTSGYLFTPKSQEAILTFDSGVPGVTGNTVVAGEPFDVTVDTAPKVPFRPDTPPPAFEGRKVELQQRVKVDQWMTVATSSTNAAGTVRFRFTLPTAGEAVFRARQDDYFTDGNKIGWFPSFPTYVRVEPKGP